MFKAISYTNPATHAHKERQVLTSQQLFMVNVSPIKNISSKNKKFSFKAELRDAFTIICYDGNKTITELDWTMCAGGKCPIPGTYVYGTKGYDHLDVLIAEAKKNAIEAKRKMDVLRNSK